MSFSVRPRFHWSGKEVYQQQRSSVQERLHFFYIAMEMTIRGPEIDKSALLIVDMQNDFVHPEGGFAHIAREAPEAGIGMPFLMGTIPYGD